MIKSNTSVQASQAKPPKTMTMTTKEMSKTFLPIILFSIILPLIDIVTDLRLIIRLYSSSLYSCIPYSDLAWIYGEFDEYGKWIYGEHEKYGIYHYEDGSKNISYEEWKDCTYWNDTSYLIWNDLSDFCQQNPNPCIQEKHIKFATLLLGELNMSST